MPEFVSIKLVRGSKAWQAFVDGKVNLAEVLLFQYGGPVAEEVQVELGELASDGKGLLDATVTNWDHKPDFVTKITRQGVDDKRFAGKLSLSYTVEGPNAENWQRVNDGVPAHRIPRSGRSKRPMPMRPYTPHTTPGTVGGPGAYGAPEVFARVVQHPGIAPRHFDQKLAGFFREQFRRRFDNAIKRAKRRLGL